MTAATSINNSSSLNVNIPVTVSINRDTLSPTPSEVISAPVAAVTPTPAPKQPAVSLPSSKAVFPIMTSSVPVHPTSGTLHIPAPVSATPKVNVVPPLDPPAPTKTKSKSKKSKSKPTVTMATADKPLPTDKTGANGENTGRWTAEEHRLFLQGLEEHGKGWKKIASLIKSRTVVQIRTHAQKYFQKLAKARQNGEEGDVAMEGRGGASSVGIGTGATGGSGQGGKRRRQTSGTKRKSISGVVASAQRDGEVKGQGGKIGVAPALAPYVVQPTPPPAAIGNYVMPGNPQIVPNINEATSAALEDSLYRFLTPATGDNVQPINQNNENSKAENSQPLSHPGATHYTTSNPVSNPSIILPSDQNCVTGEGSPTSVADNISFPPFLPSSKEPEPPQWYSRASDVDDLLNDADALDWLTDTGDLNETYKHTDAAVMSAALASDETRIPTAEVKSKPTVMETNATGSGMEGLPPVVSSSSIAMDSLPSLFESTDNLSNKRLKVSSSGLFSSVNDADSGLPTGPHGMDDEGFSVFDSNFDEQAFVTALLESNENAPLSVLS